MRKASSIAIASIIASMFQVSLLAQTSYPGITEPREHTTISATISGRVAAILNEEGASVKKGDIILEFEKEREVLEVNRRKLIKNSKVEINSAELQMNTLKIDYEATKNLFDSTQSVSEEEFLKKELEYKLAVAEYERLKQAEEREDIEYKMAVAELEQKLIRAPFDGEVVKIFLNVGESANQGQPVVKIVNTFKCKFVTFVDARSSYDLKENQRVSIVVKNNSGPITLSGKINFISPIADPSSGLREVKAYFENPKGKIQPGVKGYLTLGKSDK